MNYVLLTVCPKDVLFPVCDISFEGHVFSGPADIERYLGVLYGETWSELPPEDQRRNHAPEVLDFGDGND